MKFKKPKRKDFNLDDLWRSLESLCCESPDLLNQIKIVKSRAQRKVINWQADVLLLLSGLKAGIQSLPDEDYKARQVQKIDALCSQTREIPLGNGGWIEFLLFSLTFLSSVVCTTFVGVINFLALPLLAVCSVCIFAVFSGALHAYLRSRYLVRSSSKKQTIQTFLGSTFISAILSIFMFVAVQGVFAFTQKYAASDSKINRLSGDNADFARKYLSDNFGIALIIEDSHDIWKNSYTFVGGGSPASILPSPNLCRLIYSENGIDHWINIKNPEVKEAFKKVITVHELGHCATISPDFVNLTADGKFQSPLHSFPKEISGKITSLKDLESLDNSESAHLSLYREATADLFALGYAKIHYKSQYKELATYLRDERKTHGNHHTYCWLDKAFDVSAPSSDSELAAWALNLVEKIDCSLEYEIKTDTPTTFFKDLKSYFKPRPDTN